MEGLATRTPFHIVVIVPRQDLRGDVIAEYSRSDKQLGDAITGTGIVAAVKRLLTSETGYLTPRPWAASSLPLVGMCTDGAVQELVELMEREAQEMSTMLQLNKVEVC